MIHNIDNVYLTVRACQAWILFSEIEGICLQKTYPDLQPTEVPTEQFRVLPNGIGQIFVKVRDIEIKMNIPSEDWSMSSSN